MMLTRLSWVSMNLKNTHEFESRAGFLQSTYPTQSYQFAFFRKLHHKLFFIHSTCITSRVLFRYQQRSDHVLTTLVLAQQYHTTFPRNETSQVQVIAEVACYNLL